jgi:hypothetical protein
MAEALGYCAFPARGSRGVVDIVCFDDEHIGKWWNGIKTPLAIQVGGAGKAVARTLAELDAAPRPIGSLCVVARRIRAKNRRISWRFHTAAGTFATLAEAIAARRE